MISITDRSHKPEISEIGKYILNPLFDELFGHLTSQANAKYEIAYSGDKILLGWNVRLYKSGKTLCRVYPRNGSFAVLVVVGRKEKVEVESLLPQMSEDMQTIYNQTKEGMGQKWLLFEMSSHNQLYEDILTLIAIRQKIK